MSINSSELKYEKEYLNLTKDIIKSLIQEKENKINKKKLDIIKQKKHLWLNKTEYNGPEMYNTMDEDDLAVNIINSEIIKINKLYRSLESPFFGRVNFKTDKEEEYIYVGITGVEKDFKNYVYDWRAPISNLYYNYGLGRASYVSPLGVINGNITLKRQFKIEFGNIKEAFESDVTLEDEMLQIILLTNNTLKIKNIVSTIQKEQNQIIRFGGKDHMIIEGVAGSGKTSVALHRIAYLLYNQKNLTNKNVLIFSPNDIFTNYISDVLPELGEENVRTVTLNTLIKNFIPNIKTETLAEFIESFYENNNKLNKDIVYKFSEKYIKDIDDFVKKYIDKLTFTKKIGLKKKFVESRELNRLFKESARRLSLNDRINYIALKLCDIFGVSVDDNTLKFESILKDMLGLNKSAIDFYREFLETSDFATNNTIPYEDLVGILYLYFELNGYPNYSHIRHVIIDEAQDYSILAFKLFKKIFNSALFTVLGDSNQIINPYLSKYNLDCLLEIFSNGHFERLTKTYRSSSEIIDFSNKIINVKDIKSIRKPTNKIVKEKNSENYEDILRDIDDLKMQYKRIAVITKTYKEANELYDVIKSKDIGLITDSIHKKVVIVPSYLSKGLEFEAVILFTKKNNKFKKEEAYLYYVSATRAQHELIVYNQN